MKSSDEFALLTDEIALAWAGMTTKQYKNFKELTKENLRDNMTNLEGKKVITKDSYIQQISKMI